MRILLVEDDALLGKALETGLAQANYTPEWVKDGESALLAAEANDFDAILLDVALPKLSGLDVLRKLRARSVPTPVIIMTARDRTEQRVQGLDLGADDYLVKPFELVELLARIRAVSRRAQGRACATITCLDVKLEPASRTVTKQGEWVKLAAKEYQVLEFLMERAGRILSKSEIEAHIYGWNKECESNTVEAVIYNIRKKLGRDLIATIRGVGYMASAA